jgi:3-oxoacyl-[acyl-carrier protein] reductase
MKHVIVTGGSRGLGAAMIAGLLADGYRVSTCSRSKTEIIDQLSCEYADRFFWAPCEVGEADQVDAFVAAANKQAGDDRLWGLVNNAGIAQAGILASFPNVESERILKVNLLGTIQMARAAAKVMLAQKTDAFKGGRIINISSIIGTRGYNGLSAYSASKAGVDGFSRALARELGPRQITVNSVAPGYVATEMSATLNAAQMKQIVGRTPLGRLASEDDILNAVRFFLGQSSSAITGQTLIIDGGISC